MNVNLLAIAQLCETLEVGSLFKLPGLEIEVIERTMEKVRISLKTDNGTHIWWKPMNGTEEK